jgi:hypothetical protein
MPADRHYDLLWGRQPEEQRLPAMLKMERLEVAFRTEMCMFLQYLDKIMLS